MESLNGPIFFGQVCYDFMIWLETPNINEFQQQIVLYKRYIDNIFLIWSGSSAELCHFREKLGNANDKITFRLARQAIC
jgi:hypothetical protein